MNALAQSRGRRIEFFGLPGAGKTVTAKIVQRKLADAGIATVSTADLLSDGSCFLCRQAVRVRLLCRGFWRNLSLYLRAARFVVEVGQDSPRDTIKVLWNLWAVMALFSRFPVNEKAVMVADQGFVQAIWSIGLTSSGRRTTESWQELLREIGFENTLFVVIDAPPHLARTRLLGRKSAHSRMQSSTCIENLELWAKAQATQRRVLDDLREVLHGETRRRLLTFTIDENKAAEDLADAVTARFLAMIAELRTTADAVPDEEATVQRGAYETTPSAGAR
jgi:thymidylate kinase